MLAMYIRSVSVSNIRCFGRGADGITRLSFRTKSGGYAGWTVVAGRNGAGKTALLQAIACGLSGPRAADRLVHRLPDPEGWIHQGRRRASVEVHIDSYGMDDWLLKGGSQRNTGVPLSLKVIWSRSGGAEPKVEGESDDLQSANAGPWAGAENGWFAAGYGVGRRLRGGDADSRKSRLDGLFDDELTTSSGLSWLTKKYTLSVAWRLAQSEPKTRLDPEAMADGRSATETIERVQAVLNRSKLLPVDYEVEIGSGGLFFVKQDLRIPLAAMSHGYRVVVGLVLDVLSKLDMQLDGLQVSAREAGPVFVAHGVVLIDEVDLHLHPAWQSDLGEHLTTLFPNLQFIVTTHSAFACHNADCLIRLGAQEAGAPVAKRVDDSALGAIVNGEVDDIVLSELFALTRSVSREAESMQRRAAKLKRRFACDELSAEEEVTLFELLANLPDDGTALWARAQGRSR